MPFKLIIMRPLRAIVPLHASCRHHLKPQEAAIARDISQAAIDLSICSCYLDSSSTSSMASPYLGEC
jgi:hypothetical protein